MTTNNKYKFFILTGDPGIAEEFEALYFYKIPYIERQNISGVGKTTLTKKLSLFIAKNGVKASGFYTEEIRRDRVREGFDIVTLSGERAPLARDLGLFKFPVKYKVGKYGVLVEEFEKLALPSLDQRGCTDTQLLVIDEIGKMEFFSEQFKCRVRDIFSTTLNYIVLATIPMRKSDHLIENIRNHSQGKVWTITRENRNTIHEDIMKEMKITLNIH